MRKRNTVLRFKSIAAVASAAFFFILYFFSSVVCSKVISFVHSWAAFSWLYFSPQPFRYILEFFFDIFFSFCFMKKKSSCSFSYLSPFFYFLRNRLNVELDISLYSVVSLSLSLCLCFCVRSRCIRDFFHIKFNFMLFFFVTLKDLSIVWHSSLFLSFCWVLHFYSFFFLSFFFFYFTLSLFMLPFCVCSYSSTTEKILSKMFMDSRVTAIYSSEAHSSAARSVMFVELDEFAQQRYRRWNKRVFLYLSLQVFGRCSLSINGFFVLISFYFFFTSLVHFVVFVFVYAPGLV